MNEGALSARLGLAGWPAVAEEAIIARDVLLAEHVGSRLHVCHVSTAGSVEVIRWAKARGIPVTAEVTPHHLLLTEELVESFDPIYKVNPPLRRAEDVYALREAVVEGTIDIIATDHAPHPREDKDCEWAAAAMGMVGLETALGVAVEVFIESGLLSWRDLADRMSTIPARIGEVPDQGMPIAPGSAANITVWDPSAQGTLEIDSLAGKSGNSPYLGRRMPGAVRHVLFRGRPTVVDGALA